MLVGSRHAEMAGPAHLLSHNGVVLSAMEMGDAWRFASEIRVFPEGIANEANNPGDGDTGTKEGRRGAGEARR